jgi:hypothetical protein
MIVPIGLRVFVIGLELWYQLQTHWFSGNFRLQAVGVVLLLYWVLGCLVVFTREKPKAASRPGTIPTGTSGETNLFDRLDPTLETTDYNPAIGEQFINCSESVRTVVGERNSFRSLKESTDSGIVG